MKESACAHGQAHLFPLFPHYCEAVAPPPPPHTHTHRQTALEALGAWPGGLHMGGGVNTDNARMYLEAGASHVIVTSFVFREGRLDEERLRELVRGRGGEERRMERDGRCRALLVNVGRA